MCSSSALDSQLIKFKTNCKGKRNPQTCYWIRASQTAQSQGCLFAFFSILAFKKCLVPYCSFLCWSGREGQNTQPPKASTICSLFSILQKTDPNLSYFWETLLPTAIFVCCKLDIWVNWAVWNCLFAQETINSPRAKKNFNVSLCQIFEWTFSHGLSHFCLHVSRTRFNINYLKSLNVIKEMVNMQCGTIELWMHLGGLLSTQEARVAWSDSQVQL